MPDLSGVPTWAVVLIALTFLAVTWYGSWVAASRSQVKQPEDRAKVQADRQQVIAETAELVVTMLREELEDCLKRRSTEAAEWATERKELRDDVDRLNAEVAALKAEVARLDPGNRLLRDDVGGSPV